MVLNVRNITTVMNRQSLVASSWIRESRGTWSCHLTGRYGVQLSAAVDVTLRIVLERSIVQSAVPEHCVTRHEHYSRATEALGANSVMPISG